MIQINLTPDKTGITSSNITLDRDGRWAGELTPSSQPWADEVCLLDNWGAGICHHCGRQLQGLYQDLRKDERSFMVHGIGCVHCRSVAYRIYMGGRGSWWYFDNFHLAPSFLPPISHLVVGNPTQPAVALHGQLMGINWGPNGFAPLYPYGLDILGNSIGHGVWMLMKVASSFGYINHHTWGSAWPKRSGMIGSWMVFDIGVNRAVTEREPQEWVNRLTSRYHNFRTNPKSSSAQRVVPLLQAMMNCIRLGEGGDTEGLKAAAKILGLINEFNSEIWQKEVAKSLGAFGDPAKVLKTQKVLRARG